LGRYGRRRRLAEPLFEHVERAGVGLVAVGLAGVGDDDRPILPVGCSARGGFDSDVGGDTGEHEGIDARDAEHGVECSAVEPAGRLSPDDRFIGSGGDVVDNLDGGSTLQMVTLVGAAGGNRTPDIQLGKLTFYL
jgi:hypothetical protein